MEVSSYFADIKEPAGAAALARLVTYLLHPAFIKALSDALSIVEGPSLLAVGLSHLITRVATPGRHQADQQTMQMGRNQADGDTNTMRLSVSALLC